MQETDAMAIADAGAVDARVPGATDLSSSGVETPRTQASCDFANRVLTLPSPFADALHAWAQKKLTTKAATRALIDACDHAGDEPVRPTESAACTFVGLLSMAGDGTKRDPEKAFAYFQRGARAAFDFHARDYLSEREVHGIDRGGAVDFMGIGCPGGCAAHCARATAEVAASLGESLGSLCTSGHGAACSFAAALADGQVLDSVGRVQLAAPADSGADTSAAVKSFLTRACTDGVGPACEDLAYRAGENEVETANRLMKRACALQWGDACLVVGSSFAAASDDAHATVYWNRACALGMSGVCEDLAARRASGTSPVHP